MPDYIEPLKFMSRIELMMLHDDYVRCHLPRLAAQVRAELARREKEMGADNA